MSLIRVYVFCYKRNHLLPRAIRSLLNQTFTDWVCELHCDAPDNAFPAQLVANLNDPRIILHQHKENLGLTRTFNLAFQQINEKYRSILEEDNWWEPEFLEKMLMYMQQQPQVRVAWANMKLWQEKGDDWIDTGKNIWGVSKQETVLFDFPNVRQISGALHSQGAMLLKSNPQEEYTVPYDFDSGALEGIRERIYNYPIMLVSEVLGNYAINEATHRSDKAHVWSAVQMSMIASFLIKVKLDKKLIEQLIANSNQSRARNIHLFILIGILEKKLRWLLYRIPVSGYLFFILYACRRYKNIRNTVSMFRTNAPLYQFLLNNTPEASLHTIK